MPTMHFLSTAVTLKSSHLILICLTVLVPTLMSLSSPSEALPQVAKKIVQTGDEPPSVETKFKRFLDDTESVKLEAGKQVFIVVPTSGCPGGINWAIDYYEKHPPSVAASVKNLIVAPNSLVYQESPLPEIIEVHYQGNLTKLNQLGFYPKAPQVAYIDNGEVVEFMDVKCRPQKEVAARIEVFLDPSKMGAAMVAGLPNQ